MFRAAPPRACLGASFAFNRANVKLADAPLDGERNDECRMFA